MKPPNNLEIKTPSDTYCRVQLVCKNVHAHSTLEPPLEYNQDQTPLANQGSLILLTILGVIVILCSFRSILEGKTGIEILESSKLESLRNFSASNFALSDAEDNTSGPLNKGGIVDLPLLETLYIGNSPKVRRTKFLLKDGLFCFISICKFGSFKNHFATTGCNN